MEAYSLNGVNEIPRPIFGGKNRTVEAYVLKGINEILPPVFFYFLLTLEKKNRYVGIVFNERYRLNFSPYCLYFSSGFGKNRYNGSVFTEGYK